MSEGPFVPDNARELIGSVIERATCDPVSEHHLRQYLVGTNDRNPAYRSASGGAITPPLFFLAAARDLVYRSDLEADGQYRSFGIGGIRGRTMEGGTEIDVHQPVRVGDVLHMEKTLESIEEKQGRSGRLVFVVTHSHFRNQNDDLVAEFRHTLIFR